MNSRLAGSAKTFPLGGRWRGEAVTDEGVGTISPGIVQ